MMQVLNKEEKDYEVKTEILQNGDVFITVSSEILTLVRYVDPHYDMLDSYGGETPYITSTLCKEDIVYSKWVRKNITKIEQWIAKYPSILAFLRELDVFMEPIELSFDERLDFFYKEAEIIQKETQIKNTKAKLEKENRENIKEAKKKQAYDNTVEILDNMSQRLKNNKIFNHFIEL